MITRARRLAPTALVIGLGVSTPVAAMFLMPDLEDIPVERLITNLERLNSERPGDARMVFNLGRAHAMAYALKTDTLVITRGEMAEGPWPGHQPLHMQIPVQPAANDAQAKAARQHLSKAIARYREALTYDDDRTGIGRLSLGWALAEAGDRDQAVEALRAVVRVAWPNDRTLKGQMRGWRSLTEEAARYLIPLLDANRDREEIATLRGYVTALESTPRMITPIAIPLRAGLGASAIVDDDMEVLFDADGSGHGRHWSWITADAGWLVYDHRGTGRIESALQLFGSVSFWMFWDNGYQALEVLDDDGDGRIASRELDGLAVWHDRNSNGNSEPGEVAPVTTWGIASLSYTHAIDPTHPDEIVYSPHGVTFTDGTTRPTFDVLLERRGGRSAAR